MADEAMGATDVASTEAVQAENVELTGDNKEFAIAIASALVDAGVKAFSLDASGEEAVVVMDGATASLTADDLAMAMDNESASEEQAEGAVS